MPEAPAPTASCEGPRAFDLHQTSRRGGQGARERLVASHLDMVRAIASRYRGMGLSFDDLVQEGCIGLLEAIDRYDPARGAGFDAFARFRVRRAIRNSLTDRSRLIRLPRHVVARRRLLEHAQAELEARNGRPPTQAELARATGLSESAIAEARAAPGNPLFFGELAPAEEWPAGDLRAPDPERELIAADRSDIVRRAVSGLCGRQADVIRRRFGLVGGDTSVTAVAQELHVSERRARTIEHDALNQLAHVLERALVD
jgi:RNA polymerase sigma factor (sigma-70 family)